MSRYTDPVCKLCRREGKKLFLKGERCYTNKCSVERRSYAPGQHGQSRKKTSEYGLQLRAKQQARRYYGIQESQFRKYFEMAERHQGVTGENLLRICESRLDNVVYLLGWASSRAEGRQLVKEPSLHAKRMALAYITKEDVVKKLFDEIAPKYKDVNGGYCRIIKTGPRRGDAAEMCIIELV